MDRVYPNPPALPPRSRGTGSARIYGNGAALDISEDRLIEAIARVVSNAGERVKIGAGDDAAVLAASTGETVITTDALVEGVHLNRSYMSARDIGYRSIAVNLSDIAAMAASPSAAVVALILPSDASSAFVMEVLGGMREACDEHGVDLVGGDLSTGPALVVAPAVIGEVAPGRALTRSGAEAGDAIVVTGSLGAAGAGLRISRRGGAPSAAERELVLAHVRPVARVGEAKILARHGATSMMDLSDGLGLDLTRMAKASGVGARVERAEVPVAAGATWDEAIGGGEDYELLAGMPVDAVEPATADLRDTFGVALTRIGWFTGSDRMLLVEADGTEGPLEPSGWDHFSDG